MNSYGNFSNRRMSVSGSTLSQPQEFALLIVSLIRMKLVMGRGAASSAAQPHLITTTPDDTDRSFFLALTILLGVLFSCSSLGRSLHWWGPMREAAMHPTCD
jgi:hypothetical protein